MHNFIYFGEKPKGVVAAIGATAGIAVGVTNEVAARSRVWNRALAAPLALLADLTKSSNKAKAAYCKNRSWGYNICDTSCRKHGLLRWRWCRSLGQTLVLVLELALNQGLDLD